MVDMLQQDLENPALVPDCSSKGADSNSSKALDLSYKYMIQWPETTNESRSPNEMQQTTQQSSNSPLPHPMNLCVKAGFENEIITQKRNFDGYGRVNPYYEINVLHISDNKVHNGQIHCNEINVDQVVHTPLNNDEINQNNTKAKQVTTKDINSNISLIDNTLPTLHQPSISMIKLRDQQKFLTNSAPMTDTRQPQTSRETETSTMLTSIAKATRPFKIYPKDPLTLSGGNNDNCEAYKTFRKNVLQQIKQTDKEGTNPKMRRTSNSSSSPMNNADDEKINAYQEKRRKNNLAAKRSRDARRLKEDEIAIRATYLEYENIQLRKMLQTVANKMWENKIPFDFRPFIEMNTNTPDANTADSSSSLGC